MAGGNFFEQFTFWNTTDPTNGFVQYQSQDGANSLGLISSSASNIQMSVDHTSVVTDGRPSVRITSKASYQSGLFIIDLDHMPGGICGTWPAFWLVGPDWPNQGEVDIIEGANNQQTNSFTLHTGPGCTIDSGSSSSQAFSGTVATSNCDVNAAGQANNVGCGITTTDTATYGTAFNNNKGGVFATEWSDSGISIYFFERNSIPSDISSGSPDPSSWSEPIAAFGGSGCNFGQKFTNQQIVFDTTFCGDWAGDAWGSSTCSSLASTCNDYVGNTPGAFKDAFWSVNSLKVYQNGGGSSPAPSSAPAPAPSSAAPQPSTSAWGGPQGPSQSAAPQPSTPQPSAPQASTSFWAGPQGPSQSTFATAPSVAPVPSAAPAPSGAPTTQSVADWSGQPGWPASKTGTGAQSWQSGWTEVENSDGSFNVGHPVHGRDASAVDASRVHSRHLARHRRARHAGGVF